MIDEERNADDLIKQWKDKHEENPVKRKRNMSFISHQKVNVKKINKVKTNQTFRKFKKMNSFISNSNNLNLIFF